MAIFRLFLSFTMGNPLILKVLKIFFAKAADQIIYG
jgi:hypothetical protein